VSVIAGTTDSLEQRLAARAVSAPILLRWRGPIAALIIVILFIPIRRYTLPARLPFELEPYRLLVIALVLGWLATLLVDPRARIRRSGLEAPLAVVFVSIFSSIALNSGHIVDVGVESDVLKSLTFFLSFIFVFYLIVSVIHTADDVDLLAKVLVTGGAIVGLLAVCEWRTGGNVFNHLRTVFPFLELNTVPDPGADITGFTRGGRLRTYASAEHPIALGAALIMLVPLALYLGRKRQSARWFWRLAALLLWLGAFATASRTFVVMSLVIVLVFLLLRPRETLRLWPAVIPLLLAVHFILPNTLGIIRSSLFPSGGLDALISEQGGGEGKSPSTQPPRGRLGKIGPTFDRISGDPLLGVGYGSQVLTNPKTKAIILDNQWLATLVEIGIVGALGWAWLFVRFLRRVGRAAKEDDSDRAWLLVAIAASVAAFAVSMLLYDAFAFIQVTFLFFVLLGLGSVLVQRPSSAARPRKR
jgi:hypothetical protein